MIVSPNARKNESGNILIYILGAIFLLGLLVVLIRGSSGGGGNIDEETLIIRAAEVQEYGAELESAVALILTNGFSESDIRFAHPDANAAYGVITDTPERQVFSRSGGGATFRAPPSGIQSAVTPWIFNARNRVHFIGTENPGNNSNVDLIALLPYVTQDFCILLNDRVGVTNPAGIPPQDATTAEITVTFDGTYTLQNNIAAPGDALRGKPEGCFEGGGTPATGTYHYYRVLHAR